MTQLQQNPTHAHCVLLGFAMILAAILYVDRVCISQSQHLISADLGLQKKRMGLAFTFFGIACGLFEIPGGWLADGFGPRRTLTGSGPWRIVILVIAGWYALGALCWLDIDPVTPIVVPERTSKDEFPIPRIPAAET